MTSRYAFTCSSRVMFCFRLLESRFPFSLFTYTFSLPPHVSTYSIHRLDRMEASTGLLSLPEEVLAMIVQEYLRLTVANVRSRRALKKSRGYKKGESESPFTRVL